MLATKVLCLQMLDVVQRRGMEERRKKRESVVKGRGFSADPLLLPSKEAVASNANKNNSKEKNRRNHPQKFSFFLL